MTGPLHGILRTREQSAQLLLELQGGKTLLKIPGDKVVHPAL